MVDSRRWRSSISAADVAAAAGVVCCCCCCCVASIVAVVIVVAVVGLLRSATYQLLAVRGREKGKE